MRLSAGFHNISERDYHADPAPAPSLSSSIAKVLLAQTPRHAALAHPRLNRELPESEPSRAAEVGTVAHKLLTGKGAEICLIDAASYQTKAAKEARAEAYAAGKAPILAEDHRAAVIIAAAVIGRLAAIPQCEGALSDGVGEQVLLWQDTGGIWCRAMLDWWQASTATVYDIKTTQRGLSDREIQSLITGGWDVSAGHYIRGLTTLMPELAGRFRFRWIVVEQSEPHEVRIIEADRTTLEMGDRKAAMAISKWRECMVMGEWPGYPAQIDTVEYPMWELNRQIEREAAAEDMRDFEPLSMGTR